MKDYTDYGDAKLVSLVLHGDSDAYGEIVCRYKTMVYGTAAGIISDRYAAEDAAQEAFIDGYMLLARLREPSALPAWLHGIARRKALNHISRRRVSMPLDELAEFLADEGGASPERQFIRNETILAIRRAVSALSEKSRAVTELFYFENLPVTEIARRLSLPEGTVKSRLHDAREKLKGVLSEMNEINKNSTTESAPSAEFERKLREKIEELKNYYHIHGGYYDDGYDALYAETEKMAASLPESREKNSALADIYLRSYWKTKDKKQLEKARENAENGKNAEVLCALLIDDIIASFGDDYESWIKRLTEEAIPKMEVLGAASQKGKLLFWRGAAVFRSNRSNRLEAAADDFTEAVKLIEPCDVLHACAVCAVKTLRELGENAENPCEGVHIMSESYEKAGSKLIFKNQPGWSGNSVLYNMHRMECICYFSSRFDNMFFDTGMEVGRIYESRDENSTLTLVGYGLTVTTAAGVFDRCMHLHFSDPSDYDADIWYAEDTGLVKAAFSGSVTESYELSEYEIRGGDGYFPFCVGNRWRYVKPDLPDYLYSCYENEIDWTDGVSANLSVMRSVTFKKNYLSDCVLDSELYIEQCDKLCGEWKIDEAVDALKRAVRVNSSQNAVAIALAGIDYLTRLAGYKKLGYRFCPSSENGSYLTVKDGRVVYDECGAYSFGPYQYGTRYAENRIFGVKPFRYLQWLFGRVYDEKWVPGYSESGEYENVPIKLTVSDGGTVVTAAGSFENCIKVTVNAELKGGEGSYYFDNGFEYQWCGTKEYYFARGVGIVRFDSTWGDSLSASSELTSYSLPAADDSYFPLCIGNSWVYDEMNLTREGYRARRSIDVLCGMNGRYLTADAQEFVYLDTEAEYEAFKAELERKKNEKV